MENRTIAKVALLNTAYSFDRLFDYLVPESLVKSVQVGCRVLLPFGSGSKVRQGIIFEITDQSDYDTLKSLQEVLDKSPLLNQEMLKLALWMKERYFCTLFEAAKLLLPTGIHLKLEVKVSLKLPFEEMKQEEYSEIEWSVLFYLSKHKKVSKEKLLKELSLSQKNEDFQKLLDNQIIQCEEQTIQRVGDATQKMVCLCAEIEDLPKLTSRQNEVMKVLRDVGMAEVKELCYFTGVTVSVVQNLEKKGLLRYEEHEIYRNPYQKIQKVEKQEEIFLTEEQYQAYEQVYQQYKQGKGSASLLYGITGSGKTKVFMRLIDKVCEEGKSIIVMVPEISLTPQTLELFHERYGNKVAVFHSGLSLAQRMDEWKRVKNKEASIVVGTRSAVFAPIENLGLIIMDEEQEYTYKSESSPRYHARDVAKFRCVSQKALLLLSSATPSIETYYHALNGKYSLNTLSERYGNAKLPLVSIIDMNEEPQKGNTSVLSIALFEALLENLKKGKQSIVLLNRRGYNTFLSCQNCDHVITCPNCSISLTYHTANNRMLCHYCGFSMPFSKECPECHQDSVRYSGSGTQKAEQQLKDALPKARILRLDTDSTMARFSYEKKLKLFAEGEYDIIVGTQMVAKGLDFENVTLVGVLSADQALYSNDFKSSERAFNLLTQVVGRSGRGDFEGHAMIQSFTPENDVICLAAEQDYLAFYEREILFRKAMLYPPFVDIVMIGFVGLKQQKVSDASVFFLRMLGSLAKAEYASLPMRALSPSAAMVPKVSNKYRYKLVIKCRNTKAFREMLSRLLIEFSSLKAFTGVTAYADVNPDIVL